MAERPRLSPTIAEIRAVMSRLGMDASRNDVARELGVHDAKGATRLSQIMSKLRSGRLLMSPEKRLGARGRGRFPTTADVRAALNKLGANAPFDAVAREMGIGDGDSHERVQLSNTMSKFRSGLIPLERKSARPRATTMDPELLAVERAIEALSGLSISARQRAVLYLVDRLGSPRQDQEATP